MSVQRASVAVAGAGLLLLGMLGSYEIWQALTGGVIGFRNEGISRAHEPLLFWAAFVVSIIVAAPMWLSVFFLAIVFAMRLFSRSGKSR